MIAAAFKPAVTWLNAIDSPSQKIYSIDIRSKSTRYINILQRYPDFSPQICTLATPVKIAEKRDCVKRHTEYKNKDGKKASNSIYAQQSEYWVHRRFGLVRKYLMLYNMRLFFAFVSWSSIVATMYVFINYTRKLK